MTTSSDAATGAVAVTRREVAFRGGTLTVVEAKPASKVHITAVAARFQWDFQYLDKSGKVIFDQQGVPEFPLPVGMPIHLTLQSKDVNHSFYVPVFLFKRDVIPGRENWFDFTVDPQYAGQSFRGQCAHLCGTYHAAMVFSLKVMSASDYTTWVAEQTAAAEAKKNATPPPSAAPDAEAVEIVAEGVQFTVNGDESAVPITVEPARKSTRLTEAPLPAVAVAVRVVLVPRAFLTSRAPRLIHTRLLSPFRICSPRRWQRAFRSTGRISPRYR